MRLAKTVLLLAALVGVSSAPASAVPISYVHTGSGSGTLDSIPFAFTSFAITATGDTDDVTSCGGGCLFNDNISASITIDGLGTFSFVTGTRFFTNLGIVGFSRAGLGGFDLFNGPAAPAWDMATSISLVGLGTLLQWDDPSVGTSGGVLFFDDGTSDSTFRATVGEPVPEPSTLLLAGFGWVTTLVLRRRRT